MMMMKLYHNRRQLW